MTFKFASAALFALTLGLASCTKTDEPVPAAPTLRTKMDYATLTATTPYLGTFKNAAGVSTVDLGASAQRLNMFTEFDTYMGLVATPMAPTTLEVAKLRGMYANTGNFFSGAGLNASGVALRTATAASMPASAEAVRTYIDANITKLADISRFVNNTATQGNPGRLGRFLVDEKGIEVNQVIQKALLGALLTDQIGNVLLSDQALNANNTKTVDGKLYSELEHNWDQAYGYMTANPIMTTSVSAMPTERFIANYVNRMNGSASPGVYMAFLKGRAAVVNNDLTTAKAQANIIRTELEKTLALSARTYLTRWKAAADPGAKAHDLGEGLGFIYALRFCTKHGADAAWSDSVINGLMSSPDGAWSLENRHMDEAIAKINSKFSL